MVIKKSVDCLRCENRFFEPGKWYDHYRDIPCLIKEIEVDNLEKCPHFKRYFPLKSCPDCGSENTKYFSDRGERICLDCGRVIEERTLASHKGITKGRSR